MGTSSKSSEESPLLSTSGSEAVPSGRRGLDGPATVQVSYVQKVMAMMTGLPALTFPFPLAVLLELVPAPFARRAAASAIRPGVAANFFFAAAGAFGRGFGPAEAGTGDAVLLADAS
jgi:hypothetical protein